MSKTYTQLYVHIVFSVRYRQKLIPDQLRENLHKYITGIITKRDQKLIAVNSVDDHIHILVAYKPGCSISDLVRDIKAGSSNFINKNNLINGQFNWQEGFGAFSCSKSQIKQVAGYIDNQKEHHKVKKYKEEFIDFLNKFEIEYNDKHAFDYD